MTHGFRQWRLVLIWIVCTLVPTALVMVPLGRMLSEQLDHSVRGSEIAQSLKIPVVADLVVNLSDAWPVLQNSAVLALLITLAFLPWLTGMIIVAARVRRPPGFRALFEGGFLQYGRMIRMLVWSLIPLGIAAGLGRGALALAHHRADAAILQSQADLEHRIAVILMWVLLFLAHATLEAGRAQFVLDVSRRSAVKAWWRGVKVIIARPLIVMIPYLLITLVAAVVALLLGLLRVNMAHTQAVPWIAALVVAELISVVLILMRVTRLFALVRSSLPPAARVAGPTYH